MNQLTVQAVVKGLLPIKGRGPGDLDGGFTVLALGENLRVLCRLGITGRRSSSGPLPQPPLPGID